MTKIKLILEFGSVLLTNPEMMNKMPDHCLATKTRPKNAKLKKPTNTITDPRNIWNDEA